MSSKIINSDSINLSELIHLDKVENILNSMMKRLDQQDHLIQLLQSGSESNITRTTFERFGNEMKSVLDAHGERLTAVEAAAHVSIDDDLFTVSEVASQLHQTLGNHQVQLDACVSKRQLAPKLQQMNLSLSSEITRVLSLCAKQTEVNKIENTQKELNARVTSVERGLMNKVNTSEISYIDSLVSRLEMYTQFQDSTAKSLARIDQELTKIEENCLEFDRNIQSLDAESKQIQERADGFASKTDLQCMATELLELSQVVNQCASHDALVTLNDSFQEAHTLLHEVYGTVYTHDQTLAEMSSNLQTKADRATVQKDFVLRAHFDELFVLMGNTVDQKAQHSDVEVINTNVQGMIAHSNEIASQLAVALRFIEWFTSRGVNYEYNIGIIDKHLGGLAEAVQYKRKPYQNGVRYTPANSANKGTGDRNGGGGINGLNQSDHNINNTNSSRSSSRGTSPNPTATPTMCSTGATGGETAASLAILQTSADTNTGIDSANTTINDDDSDDDDGRNKNITTNNSYNSNETHNSHDQIFEDEILQMISEAENYHQHQSQSQSQSQSLNLSLSSSSSPHQNTVASISVGIAEVSMDGSFFNMQ